MYGRVRLEDASVGWSHAGCIQIMKVSIGEKGLQHKSSQQEQKANCALPVAACLLHHTDRGMIGRRASSGGALLPVSAVQAPCRQKH